MRLSSVCSQTGRRRAWIELRRRGRERPNLKNRLATRLPKARGTTTATNHLGTGPGSACEEASAATSAPAAISGAGTAAEGGGTLAANLPIVGCAAVAVVTPDGSGQREATTGNAVLAFETSAGGLSFNAGAVMGRGAICSSLRFVCVGSSARALATECGAAGTACWAGGLAWGKMFCGAAWESCSPSPRRYQQWRLVACSMR